MFRRDALRVPRLPPGDVFDERGVQHLSFAQATADVDDFDADETEPDPPSPERILARAHALCAVVHRAALESQPCTDVDAERRRALEWLQARGLLDELEPGEDEWLCAPHPCKDPQAVIDASWRAEGIVVLAWALGLAEMPPPDQVCQAPDTLQLLGFLSANAEEARARLAPRGSDERDAMQRQLLGVHWRLRQFGLDGRALDFRAFAADAWFGSMDLTGIPLAEDDLAIDGVPLSRASSVAVSKAGSIAAERHRAINWLAEGGHYDDVDTST